MSQEECARLREGVPYVKVYWYNPKHLCPKLNGYGDNGQRRVWSSGGSTHCTCQLTTLSMSVFVSVRNQPSTCRIFSELNARCHMRSDKIFLRSRDTADESSRASIFLLRLELTSLLTKCTRQNPPIIAEIQYFVFFLNVTDGLTTPSASNIFPNYH